MKKEVKRVLSAFMSAVLIVTAMPYTGLKLKANAVNSKVEAAVKWACEIAVDNSHGYSDGSASCDYRSRTGPDYDCASLVSTAFMKAGFDGISVANAGDMKNMFVNAGFQWIPASELGGLNDNSDTLYLQRGDILLDIGTHTELYIGDGNTVGAHWDWDGEAGGYGEYKYVNLNGATYYRSGADEINIQSAYLSYFGYDGVLRYNGSFESEITLGDINGDGKINSTDALLILQHSAGQITLDNKKFTRADVTRDGKINSSDALMILQYAVGELSRL